MCPRVTETGSIESALSVLGICRQEALKTPGGQTVGNWHVDLSQERTKPNGRFRRVALHLTNNEPTDPVRYVEVADKSRFGTNSIIDARLLVGLNGAEAQIIMINQTRMGGLHVEVRNCLTGDLAQASDDTMKVIANLHEGNAKNRVIRIIQRNLP